MAQAATERTAREMARRNQWQAEQDAILNERRMTKAKADANYQAKLQLRAHSETRRTQQLKIIEGARAKVQSVIDARKYLYMLTLHLYLFVNELGSRPVS